MKANPQNVADVADSPNAPAKLTVRLGALATNYREVLRRASPAAVAPVVKADAYSLGMQRVALALNGAGADTFFVARLEEGMTLRKHLPRARIFVLDGAASGTEPAFVAHGLTPVLNSGDDIARWSAYARAQRAVFDAAIHIDTGMNRLGLSRAETNALAANVRESLSGLNLALIMSHLACADIPDHALNRAQLGRFRAALAMLPPAPASFAATAGIGLGRDYLFDIVRPGLGLYGGNPVPALPNPYRPVLGLTARILQIRRVEEGESVGYGAAFTAKRHTILAIVAAGYADGMMRALGARGRGFIGGAQVPYVGRISMDLAALDITDVPADHIHAGAEAELLGAHISLEDLALAAGTISHEILTALSPRAERIYVES